MGDGLRELKKATGGDEHKDAATTAATITTVVPAAPPSPVVMPINAAPSVASRACPSCRGAVPVSDKFCGNCGATVEQVTRSA